MVALKIANSGFHWFMNTEFFSLAAMHLSPKFYNCGDDEGSPSVVVANLPRHILVWVLSGSSWWSLVDSESKSPLICQSHISDPYIGPKNQPINSESKSYVEAIHRTHIPASQTKIRSWHQKAELLWANFGLIPVIGISGKGLIIATILFSSISGWNF